MWQSANRPRGAQEYVFRVNGNVMSPYTIDIVRTVNGPRYYIRQAGKLRRAGFAHKETAREHVKFLEVMDRVNEARRKAKESAA